MFMPRATGGQGPPLRHRARRTRNAGCPCRPRPDRRAAAGAACPPRASGTSAQSSCGWPMFTATRPSASRSACRPPRAVTRTPLSAPRPASHSRTRSGWHCRRPRPGCRRCSRTPARNRHRCVGDLGQLVKADAAVPVAQAPRQPRRHHRPAPARVDHHEVIARAVHFHERQAGGPGYPSCPAYTPDAVKICQCRAFCP
jgi:hypothetical protein